MIKNESIIIDNIIFSSNYCESTKQYSLEDVHPLNGYYFAKIKETNISNVDYFPAGMLNKFRCSNTSLKNIFFFLNE